MSDVHNAPPPAAPTETLGNDPTVRNPDGSIKDPAAAVASSETTPQLEPAKADAKPEAKLDAPQVPDKYEFKFDDDAKIDAALVDKVTPLFKELGLSQDAANKLAAFYNEQAGALASAGKTAYDAMRDGWRNEVLADKTLGDGKELRAEVKQTIGSALGMLDAKVAADFRSAMDLTGAGDNPAFVRALYGMAKLLAEGHSVTGAGPSPNGQRAPGSGPKNAAQALYPNLPSSNA